MSDTRRAPSMTTRSTLRRITVDEYGVFRVEGDIPGSSIQVELYVNNNGNVLAKTAAADKSDRVVHRAGTAFAMDQG